jgi:predicted DNA-binding protein
MRQATHENQRMKTIRTTISLPPEQLSRLQRMADTHGLSLAWLVRQAVSEFLERTENQGKFHPLAASTKDAH